MVIDTCSMACLLECHCDMQASCTAPASLTAVLPKTGLLRLQIQSPALAEPWQRVQRKQALGGSRTLRRGASQRQAQQQRKLALHHQQQRLAAGRRLRWNVEGAGRRGGEGMQWCASMLQLNSASV